MKKCPQESVRDRIFLVNEKNLKILAIDIGNEGGMVFNWHPEPWLAIHDMPERIEDQWKFMVSSDADIIVAEDVHTFPGQGIVSNGTLLKNRGRIEGMAAAMGIEVHWIQPLQWIECYTLKRVKHFKYKRDWKKHLAEIAKEMACDDMIEHINLRTADAFLIWNYAASQQTPEPLRKMALKLA